MKLYPICAHCLLSRVYFEAELSTGDETLRHKAVEAGLEELNNRFRQGASAASVSTAVHRRVYGILDNPDPYAEKKRTSNEAALAVLPAARRFAGDSFRRAVIASIIGNSFDFGVLGHDVRENEFPDVFGKLSSEGLRIDDTGAMEGLLGDVVYIADNCGEIVFDTLLIGKIKSLGGRVTLVVRGAPMLNDATVEDVRMLGIDRMVESVMTTGSNAVGLCIEEAPRDLIGKMEAASLIISKGMANYETLSEHSFNNIAYLLRAKCDAVAKDIGVKKGDMVAMLVRR